jgi:signal recognition particle subunit SRP54
MQNSLSSRLVDVIRNVTTRKQLTERNIRDAITEIKNALLEADVNVRVVRRFVNRTVEQSLGDRRLKGVSATDQFTRSVHQRLTEMLGGEETGFDISGTGTPAKILLLGLQGSGKTTTAAKLARRLTSEGRNPLLIAADRARPAAIEQLVLLGKAIRVEVFTALDLENASEVTEAGVIHGRQRGHDVLIVDTSGRSQADEMLMQELRQVRDVLEPDQTLLVADAMTGQAAATIARGFNEQIGITGAILSKTDSDTRGGAALSMKGVTGKPICFIGTGEKLEDFELFHSERFAGQILGMGDVVSLVEKAEKVMDSAQAERTLRRARSATLTLADYLEQIRGLRKMGSIESVLDKIPGARSAMGQGTIDERVLQIEEAMILSMTWGERENYRILGPSRRLRVARGSGTTVIAVNRFLKKFEKMSATMRKMTKSGFASGTTSAQVAGRSVPWSRG